LALTDPGLYLGGVAGGGKLRDLAMIALKLTVKHGGSEQWTYLKNEGVLVRNESSLVRDVLVEALTMAAGKAAERVPGPGTLFSNAAKTRATNRLAAEGNDILIDLGGETALSILQPSGGLMSSVAGTIYGQTLQQLGVDNPVAAVNQWLTGRELKERAAAHRDPEKGVCE
jgi:hypothetical protein